MKKLFIIIIVFLCGDISLFAQIANPDSTIVTLLKEVVVSANKLPVSLKHYPGSISLVSKATLSMMPRTIAINEALRLVPGVRIANQYDAERVHISIRGQGILTENGLRGIGVIVDGIPLNDPSGFVPDLYGIDWATVQNIEVLREPLASLYGGGNDAGILYITTQNGGNQPFGGYVSQTVGSNAFTKTLFQVNGKSNNMDYRISFSHTAGKGNRDHQAFWGNILYEKINFYPTKKIKITQIISHMDYFQQNPEGIDLQQLKENPKQANPDARPFNEYQKTNRTTLGLIGRFTINKNQNLRITSYIRPWKYKETSNVAAEYRTYSSPGVNLQYNLHFDNKKIKNFIGVGADFKWQNIGEYKLKSAANPNRVESLSEANLETDTLLANKLIAPDIGTTSKDFQKVSARLGISYKLNSTITSFADWSQGFIPPSTEELASNPLAYYGFNTHLVPSTSNTVEMGFRGFAGNKFYYEVTGGIHLFRL